MPDQELQSLPTQMEVQALYDAASEAGVSPCMWIPPKWEDLQKTNGVFRDNSQDEGPFTNPDATEFQNRVNGSRERACSGPEAPPSSSCRPHPFADFSHTDPSNEYDEVAEVLGSGPEAMVEVLQIADIKSIVLSSLGGNQADYDDAVSLLNGGAPPGPTQQRDVVAKTLLRPKLRDHIINELKISVRAFNDAVEMLEGRPPRLTPDRTRTNALNHLREIAGPKSSGMQRLAQVFDWVVCRTTVLMDDLNQSLGKGQGRYNEARDNYLNFLRDIDDHEPEASDKPIDVGNKASRSAYGRALKWNCIEPVILNGRIIGVRAVVKWNPHSSSSGYALPH